MLTLNLLNQFEASIQYIEANYFRQELTFVNCTTQDKTKYDMTVIPYIS